MRRAVAFVLCMLATASCQARQLQFKNDHHLSFKEPRARQWVEVPLTIRWTMDGFHGAFAVFVDRAPMPIGKDLRWLAGRDAGCKRDPRCPDASYLADRHVFVTTKASLTLDVLPHLTGVRGDEQHYVNVVLLDGANRRIGERSWYRPFRAKRRSS